MTMLINFPAGVSQFAAPSGTLYSNTGSPVAMTVNDAMAALSTVGFSAADSQSVADAASLATVDGGAGILGDNALLTAAPVNMSFNE